MSVVARVPLDDPETLDLRIKNLRHVGAGETARLLPTVERSESTVSDFETSRTRRCLFIEQLIPAAFE